GNVQKLWHATKRQCNLGDDGRRLRICADTECSLCQIIRTSYQKNLINHCPPRFGVGIYTSTTSSKKQVNFKVQGQYGVLFVYGWMDILNDVAVGQPYRTRKADTGRISAPKGYDSVCGLPGSGLKFDETCVYDDDAIRPRYLILYDADE
ncbi:hypothetical protein GYMLUDRAFT_181904, partial [Collybiopsis luxurians FD-317 M1]